MQFKKEFSIRLIEFDALWDKIGIQALWKAIEQCVIHFGYPKIHLVSHISEPIWRMGSGDNFTTDISEWRHIDLATKSITFDRCSSTMTIVPVLTLWRRRCHILHSKAGMIMTLQKFSTNCPLPIHYEVHGEPICHVSKQLRTSPLSTLYYSRYIITEKCMSAECAEVSNWPHSEIHRKISEFPTLDSYTTCKLRRTGDTKLEDSCSDMIRMYSLTVYLFISKMGCCITINHFTTLLLLSVWDLIVR